MKKKYISHENMPPKLPVLPALWTATALKVFDAPEWLWGLLGAFYLGVFMSQLVKIITYEKHEGVMYARSR